MKYYINLLVLCFLSFCSFSQEQIKIGLDKYPRNPNVDILHYIFKIDLNDQNNELKGETTLKVKFKQSVANFSLDLINQKSNLQGMKVLAVKQKDGNVLNFTHQNDKLIIQLNAQTKTDEEQTFIINYRGVPADGLIISSNKYGERTFFGDNWANRARHWLPVIDHPYEKATCEFIVIAPNHYQVVANGMLKEESNLPNNFRLSHWVESVPLPTKVMVIGVARFAVDYVAIHKGISIQSWVYPQDRQAGFYDYALAVKILAFIENKIAPYPYQKLANVQSKTRYGGMENAGNIFYSESSVKGDRSAEALIAHEIVHQWFGDAASEADWHHVWLSEGFATYLTHIYFEETYSKAKMAERMAEDRTQIIEYFKSTPNSPIVDVNITDLNDLLNTNTYQKAAWVLHTLRMELGDELFWKGLKKYYETYQFKNALTEDFQKIMEDASGKDLKNFFREWIYQSGHPQYQGFWQYDAIKKELKIQLQQTQKNGTFFHQNLELGIYTKGETNPRIEILNIKNKDSYFTFPLEQIPDKITIDPNTNALMEIDFKKR